MGLDDLVDLENIPIEQVFENLKCNKEGLTYTDVEERLSIYGHNKLEEKTESKFLNFLRYSWNPLSRTMVAAAIMAIVLANGGGRPPDWQLFLGIVTFLIVTNSSYTFVAVKLTSDIAARVQFLHKFCRVLRHGRWCEVDSSNLVPGDIIHIKMGDIVPADVRILNFFTTDPVVKIDLSDLTGESLPVTKSRIGDCAYSGSTCQKGEIIAVVIAIGVRTRYRNAAAPHVVKSSNQVECFRRVSKGIGNFCIHFVAVVMMVEIIVMYCIQHRAYRSGIDNLLVLLIGGIPIGMPLTLLLIMRHGTVTSSHYVIKRMTTIIDMACMDVLCSDMTGTLTLGMLDVQRDLIEVFANDINKDTVALMAARACNSEECARRAGISLRLRCCPTEKQISHTYSDGKGKKHRVSIGKPEHILNHYAHNKSDIEHRVHSVINMFAEKGLKSMAVAYQEFPSDIEHRVHSAMDIFAEKVLHSIAEQANPSDIEQSVHSVIDMFAEKVLHSITLAFQEIPSDIKHTVRSMIDVFSEKVLHSIAEAYQEVPHGSKEKSGSPWQLIGLLPFVDPPREDCASSIRELLNHGVNVKMITRDHMVIGKEIGRRLGMGTNMYPSSALLGHNDKSIAADNDLSIDEIIENADGFVSCALPEQKYEIIKHLQSRKHVCGMIGGGVDDIPALKKADIRIAPYGVTEAAQNAADIVLMESGLKYLCEAVLTSRSITVRMKSCMVHAVSIAIHNVLGFMLLALVWKFDFPPFKMLIIALANCFINVIASQNRVKSSPLPVNWSLSEILTTGIVLGSYLAMSTVIFFWAVYETNFFSLDKTYMKFVLAVLLQVSSSNYALIFVTRTGKLLPGCDSLLFIWVSYQLLFTMLAVSGDQSICWSCAGKIWLYNIVFYVPLYCIKFFNQRSRKGFLKSIL
ncbi:hypothetical protein KY290_016241 [Solanum tuberosum]|uniref:Plasma membrane ATPase n=2 Tax=Solanum tuberosum TaxID=4113 RepID=M0ZM02_SOLTU|nr:hypothetical protein KY290_016241 [Solanum tuberosum]